MFYIGVKNGNFKTAPGISEISFCLYQGVSANLPAALISGSLAERARIFPATIFIFLWNTFVYCPCAYWSLNPNGWSFKLGLLDFGGGARMNSY
jgi:Amt family ammonium transporter